MRLKVFAYVQQLQNRLGAILTTVDRDRPVSRSRVYTEAELDKFDGYDNVYENAKPNYSSPRLRGYDDPQPRSRRPSRTRSTPVADLDNEPRNEPRRRSSRNRPEPRDYPGREPVRDPQSDYATRNSQERYGYEDPNSRRPRRRPAPPNDVYDEWDNNPRPEARPSRRPVADRPATPTIPTEPIRRPRPADLGRSYEPEDDYADSYSSDDLGSSYDDSDLGRSYDDEPSIPGDYVVDYQPLDDMGSDYSDDEDDRYEDDDYDNYKSSEDSVSGDDDYDDYNDRPERRQPINFEQQQRL